MSEKENKKALHDDEIEKVSGGSDRLSALPIENQPEIPTNIPKIPRIIPPELKHIQPLMVKYGGPDMFCPKDITKFTEEKPTETDEKPKI